MKRIKYLWAIPVIGLAVVGAAWFPSHKPSEQVPVVVKSKFPPGNYMELTQLSRVWGIGYNGSKLDIIMTYPTTGDKIDVYHMYTDDSHAGQLKEWLCTGIDIKFLYRKYEDGTCWITWRGD